MGALRPGTEKQIRHVQNLEIQTEFWVLWHQSASRVIFRNISADERCPNCGRWEMVAHLLLCSNGDRTQLLIDNTDKLEQWLERDGITDPELAYWIPKYILMRGNKPFEDLGAMSPGMKALARSQDTIGYRNFMEGHISIHFYEFRTFT